MLQLDFFANDEMALMKLELQKQDMQLNKIRRSLFARINSLEDSVNEMSELISQFNCETLRSSDAIAN